MRLIELGRLEGDYPITTVFEKKRVFKFFCKQNNNIHEFKGCFLRGQVNSNSFIVFSQWTVECWILLVLLQKHLRIISLQKMLWVGIKIFSQVLGLSSCTEKVINVAVHFATTRRNAWKRKEIWELKRVSTMALKGEWYIVQAVLTLLVCILYCYISYLHTTYLILNEI